MIEELTLPEFVHCELPIKDGSSKDYRAWIYCPRALSLIEIIPEDETVTAIKRDLPQKKFIYENLDCFPEEFRLVIAQNNCELSGANPIELLDKAWEWYEQYLIWESSQLDED